MMVVGTSTSAGAAATGGTGAASTGVGSSAHLGVELFTRKTGIKLLHVPYRGGAQAVQALIAGDT